jgi:dephospho-CoA kinase
MGGVSRAFGITGGMGTGKSTLAALLGGRRLCRVVEVDDLRRHALWVSDDPRHAAMRGRLALALGLAASGPGHALDRASVAERAFSSRDALEAFGDVTAPTLREDAAAASAGEGPPVAIVWSRLAEDGYLGLIGGPVAVVTCPQETALARVVAEASATADALPADGVRVRMALQSTDAERFAAIAAYGAHAVRVPNDPVLDPCAVGELLVHFMDIPA